MEIAVVHGDCSRDSAVFVSPKPAPTAMNSGVPTPGEDQPRRHTFSYALQHRQPPPSTPPSASAGQGHVIPRWGNCGAPWGAPALTRADILSGAHGILIIAVFWFLRFQRQVQPVHLAELKSITRLFGELPERRRVFEWQS